MSKYDEVFIAGNKLGIIYKRPHLWYRTKDLGNNLFTYEINSSNQLIRDNSNDSYVTNGLLSPTEPMRYVGKMEIFTDYRDENGEWVTRTYVLTFEDFRIVKAELKVCPEPIIFEGYRYDLVTKIVT